MSPPGNVTIRPAIPDDQRFVAATWFRQLTHHQRSSRWRRKANNTIDRVLDDDTTRALVACDATGRLIGWLVYSTAPVGRVIHFAYVRDEHRGQGICRRLIEQAWPGSTARLVITCDHGPHARQFLDKNRSAIRVPVEEFYR